MEYFQFSTTEKLKRQRFSIIIICGCSGDPSLCNHPLKSQWLETMMIILLLSLTVLRVSQAQLGGSHSGSFMSGSQMVESHLGSLLTHMVAG